MPPCFAARAAPKLQPGRRGFTILPKLSSSTSLLETVRVVLRATDSARSPVKYYWPAGSSGSAPPISRGEQIAPLPNWQSQPSADGLQL